MAVAPGRRERQCLWRLLEMARDEDLGSGDVTSAILPQQVHAMGRFVARAPLVFCGGALLEAVAMCYDGGIRTVTKAGEGERVDAGAVLAVWDGPCRGIMSAERVALNFLQRLSGVATTTRQYVDAVAGTGAAIYDTRKTTPGWRDLEKYAVRVGGGQNHRMGLYDAVLIKDNHLSVLARAEGQDPLAAAGRELQRLRPYLGDRAFVELEVETLEQFEVALTLPVDIILLDNMSVERLRQAVEMRKAAGLAGRVVLEASGGIDLRNVRAVADAGVERIAVGALTHSPGAVDIALDIELDRVA
ncbi:MAG TPA: carboxylating nicotinate-nucleotide diphosphorylase [Phycisphaerae bacterium]|nr:carboxylating nicotinate-nucleotide diphosphorylase [Phycisphaerae bacterium]